MFVRKIADFRPPKQPYPCPGIADFRSGKAGPCPGIADLWPDQLQAEFFCAVVRKLQAQSGRLFFLKRGSFVIARTKSSRAYIGQVLDIYKLASGDHYGSVKTENTVKTLKYSSVRVFLLQSSVILPLSSST